MIDVSCVMNKVITLLFQHLLGPIVDLELAHSCDVVPKGVSVALKHFLHAPKSTEEKEVLGVKGDIHAIIKIVETEHGFSLQVIDTFEAVTSQYFTTEKFQNSSFCYVTTAWLPWIATQKCNHSSLKEILITQDLRKCPHEPFALSIHCVCESVKEDFKEKLREKEHVITRAIMTQNIEHSSAAAYHISVRLNMMWEGGRSINHMEMCKYGGQRQLGGTIKESFGCDCEEVHCKKPKQIFLKVKEVMEEKTGEENEFDTALFCSQAHHSETSGKMSKADSSPRDRTPHEVCKADDFDIDKIIMKGLVNKKPSDPGMVNIRFQLIK